VTKQKADELGHNVGRRVAEIRQKNGLTQQGLATSVRATVQWISRIENGEENLTLATLVKLANALSVTVRELFEEPASNPKEVRRGRPRKG
jgi:transcriptional regulator with XRE-family HTH domain